MASHLTVKWFLTSVYQMIVIIIIVISGGFLKKSVSRAPFIRHLISSFVMPRNNFISEKSRSVLCPPPPIASSASPLLVFRRLRGPPGGVSPADHSGSGCWSNAAALVFAVPGFGLMYN